MQNSPSEMPPESSLGRTLVVTRIPGGLVAVEDTETGDRIVMDAETMRERVQEKRADG